jgi:hypothetical protein
LVVWRLPAQTTEKGKEVSVEQRQERITAKQVSSFVTSLMLKGVEPGQIEIWSKLSQPRVKIEL